MGVCLCWSGVWLLGPVLARTPLRVLAQTVFTRVLVYIAWKRAMLTLMSNNHDHTLTCFILGGVGPQAMHVLGHIRRMHRWQRQCGVQLHAGAGQRHITHAYQLVLIAPR